jgi:hypothetical protein
VAEAKMLSNDIVRIVYSQRTPISSKPSDNASSAADKSWVAHWRVRLTKEDVDKNFKKPLVGTETNSLKACGSMLWSSRKIYKDNDFRLAWDYDPDTSVEPVYDK